MNAVTTCRRVLLLALLLALPITGPSAGQKTGGFSGDRAFTALNELSAFGPRVPGTPAARKSGDWLLARLRALGDEAWEQPFTAHVRAGHPLARKTPALAKSGLPMRNLVCRFRPKLQSRLLFCAHWDCRPFSDQDPDKAKRQLPMPGANDSASGVAVLLELARCLKANPPAVGVDIVFFDGEDFGEQGHLEEYFLGSKHYAGALKSPLPEAGILLDMVGKKNLRLPVEPFSNQAAPELVDRVWTLADEQGFGHIFVRETGPAVQDDHLALIKRGVPTIDIIDFNYPQWHTTRDTPAACSAASLEAVGLVLEALVRQGL